MKRSRAILLVLVVLTALLAACTDKGTPQTSGSSQNTPSMTPTPVVPDYSGVDFSGVWSVYALYDSAGSPVSSDKLVEAGATFSLELLNGGTYFLYDADGKPIGQGKYSIDKNQLILSADGQQTVYIIEDDNTVRCTAQDGSAVVMKRCLDECEPTGEDEFPPEDTDAETSESISPEDTEPEISETASPEG